MEKISMSEINKEVEVLTKQIKDLLGINTVILRTRLYTLSRRGHIHKDLEAFGTYKNFKINKILLQSKVYDTVVYYLNYYYETEACDIIIKLKPSKLILISDEEYGLSIYSTEFSELHIQWRKCTDINANSQPMFDMICEANDSRILGVLTEEKSIENILCPPKFQQSFIDEMFLSLG